MILLNTESLDELKLSVCRKKQTNGNGNNFFFSPNVGLKLYNAKVLIVTQKYIVFTFEKRTHLSLLNLFCMCSSCDVIKSSINVLSLLVNFSCGIINNLSAKKPVFA